MPNLTGPRNALTWRRHVDGVGRSRPDIVLIAPYMTYLLLLSLVTVTPPAWEWGVILLRGVVSLAVFWVVRPYLPGLGKPHWALAVSAGVVAAVLWYLGQYAFDAVGLGGRLPLFPGRRAVSDPRDVLGAGSLLWTTVTLRVTVAITAVPVVEELFWRAFLLRALVRWHDFERVPLGQFTWFSFVGTALLSTLQHPDNWGVSILCWLFYNGLFYWTRSILSLIIVHAVTNLVLYAHVIRVDDWAFW